MDAVAHYFAVVGSERPGINVGNLRFYLEYLFDGVPLAGCRVLDIGAAHVVALEPEAAGSTAQVRQRFDRLVERLGLDDVELRPEPLQDFDPGRDRFDVIFMHSAINHLDEPAAMALHRDESAREVYRDLFAKLVRLADDGATLIAADCSRHNLFAALHVKNPLQPTIEWEKHQPPGMWARLLEEAGFERPLVRWSSLNTLRRPGRVLLGNRVAAWLLDSAFCLTVTRARGALG